MRNVVTVEFRTEKEAFAALDALKEEQKTYGYKILQLGLVKKENGVDTPIAGFDLKEGKFKPGKGGLIGGVIGILGGPLGIAIGAGVGAGVGTTSAKVLKYKNMALMKQAISKLPEDATILIALVEEKEEIVFDNRLKSYKYRTKITHYNVDELEKEMEEAKVAEKEAAKAKKAKPRNDMKKMEELAKEKQMQLKAEKDEAKKAEKEEKEKIKAEKAAEKEAKEAAKAKEKEAKSEEKEAKEAAKFAEKAEKNQDVSDSEN